MSPIEFRATLKEMPGFAAVMALLVGVSLWLGVTTHTIALVALSACCFGILVAVRLRYRVIVDDTTIRSRNLLAERSVQLNDVIRFERATDLGYVASRLCGPYTYEIADRSKSIRINFKFFSLDCWKLISERLGDITNSR